MGNTPYSLKKIDFIKDDHVFVRLGSLNELRRELVSKLTFLRRNKQVHVVSIIDREKEEDLNPVFSKCYFSVLVWTEEQLKVCLSYDLEAIYVVDYQLYQKYSSFKNIYYRVDRVNSLKQSLQNQKLLIGDLGSLYSYYKDNQVVTDYYLNVVNHSSVLFFKDYHVERVTLSSELNLEQTINLMNTVSNKDMVEVVIYGRIELMLLKHLFGYHHCLLEDKSHRCYPVVSDGHLSHIFHYEVTNYMDLLDQYKEFGIRHFRIELFDEKESDIKNIFQKIF